MAPVEGAAALVATEQPVPEAAVEAETEPETTPIENQEPEIQEVVQSSAPLFEGFSGAFSILGKWTVNPSAAAQTNKSALFAKLAIPLEQERRPLRYSFTAGSRGSGWVGLGLHIIVETGQRRRGYGEGKSLLVWLTHDPKHRGDEATRLQLYRSTTDVDMTLETEAVVPESVFDANLIAIDVDPVEGQVSVSLNGSKRLVCNGFSDLAGGVAVVFRALDRAEFQDFRVEGLP
jgi:hypothetical protein